MKTMQGERAVSKVTYWKPIGNRFRRRPKSGREDQVRRDIINKGVQMKKEDPR